MQRVRRTPVVCASMLVCLTTSRWATSAEPESQPTYKSPTCIALSPDGRFAYVTNHTADSLSVIDAGSQKVVGEIAVGKAPTGVVVSRDGKTVFVANTRSHSVSVVDADRRKVVAEVACGFEPTGLCLSPTAERLYAANFISDDVSVIDVEKRKELSRIEVGRTPTFMAMTPDGKKLLVNALLSDQPATNPKLTTFITVIDTQAGKVVARKRSPGVMLMGRGITVSPDGKYAYAVHHRSNFNITPSQLSQGWVHTHALTIIPLESTKDRIATVLLDNVNSGAPNPYGVAVSKDGKTLYVSHRGIHRISVIDLPGLHQRIAGANPEVRATMHVNLGFLWGRDRVIRRVASGGLGPQGIAVSPTDGRLWVANRFSDAVAVLAPVTGRLVASIPLGPPQAMTTVRRGEALFHDATQAFQQWLSCTSCHPGVRADGVNWDLLNDGMTNPKNVKSLVGSWQTPPAMSLGVRANMRVAVEKGFLFIQFHTPTMEEVVAVAAYLRSLRFIPSPWSRNPDGSLDEKAQRGRQVFRKAKCDTCHPAPLWTDLKMHDVGTKSRRDFDEHLKFDTPTLSEMYRTGPYLHDGRAATLEEVLTTFNKGDRHGVTSNLTAGEIADLVAYLKSL